MKAKLGFSPLASTSLGDDCQQSDCLRISGEDHLVHLANRRFDEGDPAEASRLLREALRGVSAYLSETDNKKAGTNAGREFGNGVLTEPEPA